MTHRDCLRDERGMTLVEMVVGISIASIVMMAMTMLIIVTMHASARDNARVSATQNSRNGLTSIIQQLQSACISPRIAPLQAESTGSLLSFTHATGSEVTPKPVLTKIALSGDTVTQYDYASTGSNSPPWTFNTATPTLTRELANGVYPLPGKTGIFSYYSSTSGQISSTPLPTPLEANRATAIQVSVGLSTAPSAKKRSADASVPTHMQDSVLLRLTAPSYNETMSPPCE